MGQLESVYIEGIDDIDNDSILHGDLTVERVAKIIRDGEVKNIVVMSGAGISVSAGIPDFRSPGTGLYYNLQKYNLPTPESMFDIDYFREHPESFYSFVMELFPEQYLPTYTHYFIKLLNKKGVLLRDYTQNIDGLERQASIPESRLVESHGTMSTCSCIDCRKPQRIEWFKKQILSHKIPRCKCGGLIKPDIVFFNEPLPQKFNWMSTADMASCDLLIVMGTSLAVQPFAGLVHKVKENVPRFLINKEPVGPFRFYQMDCCFRDVVLLGDCDSGVQKLCDLIGWRSELEDLYTKGRQKLLSSQSKFLELKSQLQSKNDSGETVNEADSSAS